MTRTTKTTPTSTSTHDPARYQRQELRQLVEQGRITFAKSTATHEWLGAIVIGVPFAIIAASAALGVLGIAYTVMNALLGVVGLVN